MSTFQIPQGVSLDSARAAAKQALESEAVQQLAQQVKNVFGRTCFDQILPFAVQLLAQQVPSVKKIVSSKSYLNFSIILTEFQTILQARSHVNTLTFGNHLRFRVIFREHFGEKQRTRKGGIHQNLFNTRNIYKCFRSHFGSRGTYVELPTAVCVY